jgi:hypothetical protein
VPEVVDRMAPKDLARLADVCGDRTLREVLDLS